MNPQIFREYDIRGLVDKDLTERDVYTLGRAMGTYLLREGNKTATLGRDCRLSSPAYASAIAQGLIDSGCDVIDIGEVPTPVFYFSVHHLKAQGGVMVTASHNPPEYNGFKICSGIDTLYGPQIQEVGKIAEKGVFAEGKGQITTADVVPAYTDFLLKNIKVAKPLTVAVDAGNGTAGVVAVPILKSLGMNVHDIFCTPDGRFPNHSPDPTVAKNNVQLAALVKEKGCDIGIGFDGDGDRIGVLDQDGQMIYGDKLLIIFAREILSRKPGAVIISEVKCSQTLYDDIAAHGGKPVMWKTGHSLIKNKMKEEKAELAGEMSGHVFFADRYLGYDDATYAACRILEIVASSGKKVSELLADVPKTYSTPELRVDCPDEIKFAVVEKVTAHFKAIRKVIDIDGCRVLYEDGWGLVRASNTQPVLVLRFEALSEARLTEIRREVEEVVKKMREA